MSGVTLPRFVLRRLQRWVDRQAYRRDADFPLGRAPRASAEQYRRLAETAAAETCDAVTALEGACGYAIDADFLHDLALHTQIVIKPGRLGYQHGRVLYAILRAAVARRALRQVTIVETGTARGFSAVCMAKALADGGVPGTIFTFDVIPHDVAIYWNCIDDADGPKSRAQLLAPWQDLLEGRCAFHRGDSLVELPKLSVPRVHFAFLDGRHTYEHVRGEFEAVSGAQRAGDIVVFDDYSPAFAGVCRAVDEICEAHGYRREVIRANDARGYAVATKVGASGTGLA